MKTIITVLGLVLLSQSVCAQSDNNKTIAAEFIRLYNKSSFDSIFNMFSKEMQQALPKDKTTEFLNALHSQAGSIKSNVFTKNTMGSYATYKTQFDNALLAVNISVDNNSKINGLYVKPYVDESLPQMKRNLTKMQLPFKGEWTVLWGGDTRKLNYHIDNPAQKNAFDILIKDANDRSFKTNGLTNEDYYGFGKELYAPCDGEVVLVVDGVKDNKPGEMNPVYMPGNSVIIKTANKEYLLFAHFKQHSIKVKQGEKIRQGQLLGQCGNSGNSSEPHLHFHIQNTEDMNIATGVKCYFDKIIVNGQIKTDYSPVQNDKIRSE